MLNNIKDFLLLSRKQYQRVLRKDVISLSPPKESDKNVLLSYIIFPFTVYPDNIYSYFHSNLWECQHIANTWLDHGYNVDVIDWDNSWFIPKKNYSVFIDIHSNMERLSQYLEKDCKKILHITGAHWQFQNNAEMKRLSDLKERRGVQLPPKRKVVPSQGIEYADCATILGNRFTQGTFSFANKSLYPIPLSTTVRYPYFDKDFKTARNNVLWLGSTGMVHKGLDLVLEAFDEMPDYNLTVCGPVGKEPLFEKAYFKELYHSHNIKTLGFVDVRSPVFLDAVKRSCMLIYPSCSEGQAGSVITALHAGLIPILSYESGVDVDGFGVILKDCSISEIRKSIEMISQKSPVELESMSKNAWQYAREHHTRQTFADAYESFVQSILLK